MKPESNEPAEFERLKELVNQLQNDGSLSQSASQELEALLLADESAREYYIRSQELHTMLEVDKSIRLQLAADWLPENVVPMPGVKSVSPAIATDQTSTPPRNSSITNQQTEAAGMKAGLRIATSFAAMIAGVVGLFWMYHKVADYPNAVATIDHQVSFEKEVLPILEGKCFSCHGEDDQQREADLRLDLENQATGGEHPVIVRGQAKDSELIARISSDDLDYRMPPLDSGKTLDGREVAILTKWIDQGARYSDLPGLSARFPNRTFLCYIVGQGQANE